MDDDEETRTDGPTAYGAVMRDGVGPSADAVSVELIDPGRCLGEGERSRLRGWLIAAVGVAGASGEVRVRVVDDREMSAAHLRYGGVEGTTDVLTFDMREDEDGVAPSSGALDVDIWACVDEARREAGARGHEVEQELLLYCLHGVLHCLGYDDHDAEEHDRMHAEEDRILEVIGVGRTYAARPLENGEKVHPGPGGQE